MPTYIKYDPVLGRKPRFLFKEYSEGTIRYDITNQTDTKLLGKKIGSLVLQSFKSNLPVKGIYTFGRIGMGKTVLSTEIIKRFENTEDLLIDVKHGVKYRHYDTYPQCWHIDYFDYFYDSRLKTKFDLKEDEMIIAEWSDYIPKRPVNFFENDKIEIELYHCFDKKDIVTKTRTKVLNFDTITSEGSMRFASMIGYGNGIAVIEALKKDKELSKIVVDPSELN